jgi:polysaccharide pyruvyl transferase WcaK-like protein
MPNMMKRRTFVAQTTAALLSATLLPHLASAAAAAPRRILLRSSWQTVNIGDIAHTPGMLALIEKHLPGVEVRLWPSKVDNGVRDMLLKRFPKLVIVQGAEMLKAAFAECDFLLHGSGPSLVAQKDLVRWSRETGKPYGVGGITMSAASLDDATRELLSGARFVYFRDSVSLAAAKKAGVNCPVMEFGPDGAFAVDLRDDAAATAFLAANGLEEGKFLCCIPRFRNTPYWLIHPERPRDAAKETRNEAMKEHDHVPQREAIAAVVRGTNLKILLCPEDQTQMAIGKEMIYDKLPAEIKARVVWRERYWLTDEAVSVYVRSAGLFGNEMHSPIMCVGNGVPAIVCRWAEQTSKGFMWRDIGLGDWLFDFDKDEDLPRLTPAVLAMAKNPAAAQASAAKAREFVQQRQRVMMETLGKSLNASSK